jgi:hypothetical protein
MVKNSPLSKTKPDNNIVLNNSNIPAADHKEKKILFIYGEI